MYQRGYRGTEQRAGKTERDGHVLPIGFADRLRVRGEEFLHAKFLMAHPLCDK